MLLYYKIGILMILKIPNGNYFIKIDAFQKKGKILMEKYIIKVRPKKFYLQYIFAIYLWQIMSLNCSYQI